MLRGAIQEALQETDLVRLGPYPVELERRRSAINGVRAAVGRRKRIRVGGFAFDGEF
ncbi:UNVERIFIED_CONTAM: hypothetical protein Slati_0228500 [Sesamum latifolium]|uniref:Uncharacterized protein n=1 Tax=Sesamum latifolium TaxID=2727402 RepID=A0AAW2YCL3_9LAMI